MSTIGYGDFSPKNDQERLLCSITTIVSVGIFGYILNTIGNILLDLKKKEEQFEKKLASINKYMQLHNVTNSLQQNVKKYLEYKHEEGIDNQESPVECLQYLSHSLQKEIFQDVYMKAINKIPALKNNFTQQFLLRLSTKMEEIVFCNGEIIQRQGISSSDISQYIYFIQQGNVELYNFQKNHQHQKMFPIQILKDGQYFGELEFFQNIKYKQMGAKSIGITYIYKLSYSEFIDTLQNFPTDYEKYQDIKQRIIFNKTLNVIEYHCKSCKSTNHSISECPYLFYSRPQIRLIHEMQKQQLEFQKTFKRTKQHEQKSTVKYTVELQIDQREYMENQIAMLEQEEIQEHDYEYKDSSFTEASIDQSQQQMFQNQLYNTNNNNNNIQNNNINKNDSLLYFNMNISQANSLISASQLDSPIFIQQQRLNPPVQSQQKRNSIFKERKQLHTGISTIEEDARCQLSPYTKDESHTSIPSTPYVLVNKSDPQTISATDLNSGIYKLPSQQRNLKGKKMSVISQGNKSISQYQPQNKTLNQMGSNFNTQIENMKNSQLKLDLNHQQIYGGENNQKFRETNTQQSFNRINSDLRTLGRLKTQKTVLNTNYFNFSNIFSRFDDMRPFKLINFKQFQVHNNIDTILYKMHKNQKKDPFYKKVTKHFSKNQSMNSLRKRKSTKNNKLYPEKRQDFQKSPKEESIILQSN